MTEQGLTLEQLYRREAVEFPQYTLNESPQLLRLHQNEMLELSDAERAELVAELATKLNGTSAFNTYPSLEPRHLIQLFAESLRVNEENIEITAGSSQALTLLAEALFSPGRTVAITAPSFSLYAHLARLYGSTVVNIALDSEFNFSAQNLFADQVLHAQVAILCSPNNPTGTVLSRDVIGEFVSTFKGVVVVDEAYFEFFEAQGGRSCVDLAQQRKNLIVLRTLSKAWAAAGLRVGAMVSHSEVIAMFRALKPPYSIAWPSEILASYILSNKQSVTREKVAQTVRAVVELQRLLANCTGVEVMSESKANFVFFRTPRAEELEQALNQHGFMIRRYGAGTLHNCVRISMPPQSQFEKLKSILKQVLQ